MTQIGHNCITNKIFNYTLFEAAVGSKKNCHSWQSVVCIVKSDHKY